MFKNFLLAIFLMIGVGVSRPPQTILMSRCNSHTHDVVVTFRDKYVGMVEVVDTGSCLVYIKGIDVYYLTKRDSEAKRIDGELFDYVEHECIERTK